jgi:energy-coupling factor transport system permease protein
MFKLAAFTKIALAVLISIGSMLTLNLTILLCFLALEIIVLPFCPKWKKAGMAIVALGIFSLILFAIQLFCGTTYALAAASALRMAVMAISIALMIFFTRTQEITAALVQQIHLPYSYAFMVTAVLRFVPDLMEESRSVREAQSCRGYSAAGSPLQRLNGYMTIIKPMLFRAIERSEHMAVSLEMRGFSGTQPRTFMAATHLSGLDYLILFGSILLLAFVITNS